MMQITDNQFDGKNEGKNDPNFKVASECVAVL